MGQPAEVAAAFAARWSKHARLDFSLSSLQTEVDRLLLVLPAASGEVEFEALATGLEAYVGETLARLYDGRWAGEFTNSATNFYTSRVEFGDFVLYPSHFVCYRLRNGPIEGTFAAYLATVRPRIDARR